MDNATYVMMSKQIASERMLGVVANNVANANTNGFKADSLLFREHMTHDIRDNTSMISPQGTRINFEGGPMQATYNPLDVAVSGPGFFIVNTPAGIRYTRNGHFKMDGEGRLVNSDGYAVLSYDGQETIFNEEDANPIIGSNGMVFVGPQERGQIGVVEFEDIRLLTKEGNNLLRSIMDPKEPVSSSVVQGSLEGSNVNAVSQIALLAQLEKDTSQTAHFIGDTYTRQRNAFKVYARVGGQ